MNALIDLVISNAILMTILAAVVFGITRVLRRPPLVYCLWLLVLLKLITPPVVQIPLVCVYTEPMASVVESGEVTLPAQITSVDSTATSSEGHGQAFQELWSLDFLSHLLVIIWLAGSALWFSVTCIQMLRFGRLLKRAGPAPKSLQAEAQKIAIKFGLRRCPEIRVVDGRISPLLWVIGRNPMVVLPAKLLDNLNRQQQVSILAHELSHLHRRDHWIRWLETIIVGIYWWHPVVWWVRRELQQAEELCCDSSVIGLFPEKTKDYATTLLKTVDFLSVPRPAFPQGASGIGQVPLLKRRIEMIVHSRLSHRLSWPMRFAVLLIGFGVLPLSPLAFGADKSDGGRTVTIEIKKDGSIQIRVGDAADKDGNSVSARESKGRAVVQDATLPPQKDVTLPPQKIAQDVSKPLNITVSKPLRTTLTLSKPLSITVSKPLRTTLTLSKPLSITLSKPLNITLSKPLRTIGDKDKKSERDEKLKRLQQQINELQKQLDELKRKKSKSDG